MIVYFIDFCSSYIILDFDLTFENLICIKLAKIDDLTEFQKQTFFFNSLYFKKLIFVFNWTNIILKIKIKVIFLFYFTSTSIRKRKFP